MPFLLKIVISAVIIAVVSEIGKRFTVLGAPRSARGMIKTQKFLPKGARLTGSQSESSRPSKGKRAGSVRGLNLDTEMSLKTDIIDKMRYRCYHTSTRIEGVLT